MVSSWLQGSTSLSVTLLLVPSSLNVMFSVMQARGQKCEIGGQMMKVDFSDFNACTKDETQKKYMLQVTEQHRNK